jgi:calcium-dependent protein kinase
MFIMLCGYPPFNGLTDEDIYAKIKKGEWNFNQKSWNLISEEAKSFISQMLKYEPDKRISATDALKNNWLVKFAPDKPLDPKILNNIREFAIKSSLKKAILTFIATQLSPFAEKNELERTFRAFDQNGDGKLTEEELVRGYQSVYAYSYTEALGEVQRILDMVDFNFSTNIDYTEFVVAAMDHEKLLSKERLMSAFEMFDLVRLQNQRDPK